jgi:hypothetical protein
LGLLVWMMRHSLYDVAMIMRHASLLWLWAAFLLHVGIIMVLLSWRMQIVYSAAGVFFSFITALKLTFVGYFFNNFFPTSMGGDIIKAYYSGRMSEKNAAAFSAVIIDRVFGLYSIFLLGSAAAAFWFHNIENPLVAWLLWAVLLFFTLFALLFAKILKPLARMLERWQRASWLKNNLDVFAAVTEFYARHKTFTVRVLGLAVLTKALSVFVVFCIVHSLGRHIPLTVLFWVVPLAFAVTLLPSLNGLGIREGVYVYFLGLFVGRADAFAISLLILGIYILSDVVGGMIYAFSSEFRKPLPVHKS